MRSVLQISGSSQKASAGADEAPGWGRNDTAPVKHEGHEPATLERVSGLRTDGLTDLCLDISSITQSGCVWKGGDIGINVEKSQAAVCLR